MSRSSYKFLYVTEEDIMQFYDSLDNMVYPSLFAPRNKTLNSLNYLANYHIHQGKVKVQFKACKFHINRKLGALTKTRKPFFFRSKKKR